jgi:hypothetical protein
MTHGFSRQDWIEYTAGARDAELEAHLKECPECRETARRLIEIDSQLSRMASEVRDSQTVTDGATQIAFAQVLGALRSSAPRSQYAEPQLLIWLELFLSHLFGRHTAQRAMQRAANLAAAESADAVSPGQWGEFVRGLSEMVADLCGEPAARLLSAIGNA